jgi:predicted SAM-dependent methyltransferase
MARAARAFKKIQAPAAPLKLDLGCGPNKREGFFGVDALAFPGVDQVVDLKQAPWPWPDNSVGEVHCSHFLEHLTATQRVAFANELYRVLVPGGTCQIIVPHWASCRAYGDPTHQWPPVSEFWFYYISKDWRAGNAPHTDAQHVDGMFACNFSATWGYSLRQDVTTRNQDYQQFAIQNYKEVCSDILATLTAVKA